MVCWNGLKNESISISEKAFLKAIANTALGITAVMLPVNSATVGSTALKPIYNHEVMVYDYSSQVISAKDIGLVKDNTVLSILKNNLNPVETNVVKELRQSFVLSESVVQFISKNSSIAILLIQAKEEIQKYFSDELYLETVFDPENGKESLFLGINTKIDINEALAKMDKFTDDWWLNNMHRAGGDLSIDVMFI